VKAHARVDVKKQHASTPRNKEKENKDQKKKLKHVNQYVMKKQKN
jgi:hypothetical protein